MPIVNRLEDANSATKLSVSNDGTCMKQLSGIVSPESTMTINDIKMDNDYSNLLKDFDDFQCPKSE